MLSQGRIRQVVSPKRVMIRLPYRDSKKMAEEMQGLTRVSCQEGVCIIQLSGCINEKKNILRSGRLFLNGRLCSTKTLSPHVRESKTSWDSGFHAVDSGFQVLDSSLGQWNLDSGFQSLVGFRIPWAVFRIPKHRIPDSFSCIPDSTSKNFPQLRNPDSLTWGEP